MDSGTQHVQERQGQVYRIQHGGFELTFDPDLHTYTLRDRGTGRTWSSLAHPEILPTDVQQLDEFRLVLRIQDHGEAYDCTVTIDEAGVLSFELETDPTSTSFQDSNLRAYPPAFRTELAQGKLCFCDRSCGVLIDTTDTTYGGRALHVYGNTQCLDMPWIGVMDGPTGDGMMVLVESPFDAEILLRREEDGTHWPQVRWLPSMGTFAYSRRLSYRFVPGGGYVALAKAYREIAAAQGKLKTLETKARERSVVSRLKGAPIVWGDIDAERFVRQAQTLGGMHRAVIANAHMNLTDDDALRRLNAQGYITTEYDSTGDIVEGETGFQKDDITKTAYRWTPGAEPAKGWQTLEGLQYYFRSSAEAMNALRRYVPHRLQRLGFNGRFMDVAGAIGPFEDYHPDHTFDRRQDIRYRRETLEYFLSFGVVVGSEHGNDWCADVVDYFEGATSGPFWWATDRFTKDGWNAGHLRCPTHRNQIPEAYLKYGMGIGVRIPLWDLVYHDCTCSTWYWGDTAGFMYRVAPELADQKDLFNILYGTVPLLWRDSEHGYDWLNDAERARFLRSYQDTCRLHEVIAFDEMLSHEFLASDGSLQRTRFSSGTVVVVNFGEAPQTFGDNGQQYVLAPFGYYVEGPEIHQSRLWVNESAVTLIRRPGFLRVVTEAEQEVGPVRGRGSLTAFETPSGTWHVTLEAGSLFETDLEALLGRGLPNVQMEELDEEGRPSQAVRVTRNGTRFELPVPSKLTAYAIRF